MCEPMPPIYNVQLNSLVDAVNLALLYSKKEKYHQKLNSYLIKTAKTKEEITILASIRKDLDKHQKFMQNFYTYFAGKEIPKENILFIASEDYLENLKAAFLDNEENIKLFTQMYSLVIQSLYNESYTNVIFEILQDAQRHSGLYNFILNLNIMNKLN
ncbi:hypothetical protein ACER0A_008575 [Haloimpatiens sp. FM7315]|uniref:hypothetical protein n=1 Tax=Haloimpatiens sp. FM7315 TaxID=3298609 RepID=UPI0039777D1A